LAPSRYQRLRAGLEARACDAAVLVGSSHTIHLAGYSRYLGGLAAVVFGADSKRTLVVPRYELEAAEETANADEVVGYGAADFLDFDPAPKLVAACLRHVPSRLIGLAGEADAFAASVPDTVRVDDLVRAVRLVKDGDEIAMLGRSYELALAAQQAVEELVASGASEIELCSAGFARAQIAAGTPIEWISVVATGPHSAEVSAPVYVAGERRIADGEPVLADLAVRCAGYWGDTTRTWVAGTNTEVEAVREAITTILQDVGRSLRPGVPACEVFEETRRAILARFPDGSFPHHAGHGIGIAVADEPQLIPTEPMALQAGMVLAIEPGVYFPGRFGVRVEDVYVVTESGGRLVTASNG
jgi:Xaa-Pro aminopeptidase